MIRRSALIWLALVLVSGTFMFLVKYEVITREERLETLNRQIRDNQEAVAVLRAEWSLLRHPKRIEALVTRHLEFEPPHVSQLITLDMLPHRPVVVDEFAGVHRTGLQDGRAPAFHSPAANVNGATP